MKRALVVGALVLPSVASAHIHLTFPLSRTDDPTGDQKDQHCGTLNYVRADHPDRISTFRPGETITVTWAETINHPGYFRIAFKPDGEVFPIPPAGAGAGGFPDENREGEIVDGAHILADRIADGTTSKQVTLPNIECTNCTLQFIQVMTDKPQYTTDAASDDIYFNCADIILAANAPDAGPQVTVDAGPGGGDAAPGGAGGLEGGCAAGGGSVGLGLGLALVARPGLRRRRRAQAA